VGNCEIAVTQPSPRGRLGATRDTAAIHRYQRAEQERKAHFWPCHWARMAAPMALNTVLRRAVFAVAICMAGLAHAKAVGTSEPISVTLDYSVASTCPEVADFMAIVTDQLERDPFSPTAKDRAVVKIAPGTHGLDGSIEWRNAEEKLLGDRLFHSRTADCEDLARAMAFALALEIQFLAIAKQAANPVAPTLTDQSKASGSREPQVSAAPEARPSFNIGAGGFVGFGLASTAAAFGRLAGGVAWQHYSLELAAEVAWPTTTRRDDGAAFSQHLFLAALAGCGRLRRWSACLLAKAGEVRVEGEIDAPAKPAGLVLQAGMRLAVRQSLGRRAYVAMHADGVFNLRPWKVALDQDVVWTSPYFAEIVGLEIGIKFR
jgi:hypothetical protein